MAIEATRIKKRIAAASIFIVAASTLAITIYLWLTPVDISRYAPEISSFIGERTGRSVSIDSVIVRFLPYPDITIKGLDISDNTGPFMRSGTLRLKVRYLPLLMRRLHISALDLKGPTIRVKRYPDSTTNIDDIIGVRGGETARSGFSIMIESARLESGTLFFTDLATKEETSFEVAGLRGTVATGKGTKRFELSGMLVPGTKVALDGVLGPDRITGSGHITAFDLGRLSPYAETLSHGASLRGKADAVFSYASGNDREIKANLSYSGLGLGLPEILDKNIHSPKGSAIVSARSGKDSSGFKIEDASITLPGFSVTGFLTVDGPSDEKTIRAGLSSTPAPLASIADLIPAKRLPQKTREAISLFTPEGGSVTIKAIEIDARLADLKESFLLATPPVSLSLGLDNISFRVKGIDEPFSGISGEVHLKGDRIIVKDGAARYGNNIVRSANATLKDITGNAAYEVASEGSIDAGVALSIARGLTKEKTGDLAEILGKAVASGMIDLSINAGGRFKDHKPERYSGSVFVSDASLSYQGAPVSIESLDADALFDEKTIRITGLRASDGSSFLIMNGRISDYAGEAPSFALAAEGKIDSGTVTAIMKDTSAASELYTEGYAAVKLTAQGAKGSSRISLMADATPAWIAYRDYIRKEEYFPAAITAFLETSSEGIAIKRASVKVGSSEVELSGQMGRGKGSYDIKTYSHGLLLEDLDSVSPYLRSEYPSSGLVSFEINATRASQETRPSYKGAVTVASGRFKTPFLEGAVERLDAAASFDGHAGRLVIDRMDVGRSDLSGTIDIEDISERKIRFDLASTRLESGDLIPKDRLRSLARRRTRPPVIGSGTVTIAGGNAWGHSFKDMRASIEMGTDLIYLNPLSMQIDGGSINIAANYHRNDEDPLLFEAAAEASGIEIEPMLTAFGVKKQILAGTLKGRGALWSTRGAEPFSSGLNGDLRLEADNGRLWKFQVMAGIFSVVNILSIDELFEEGLPYKTLSGGFTVRDGTISTEDMNLDSASLRMSASGEIDLPNSSINGVLAMHPLVTIDKIVSNIPLAGYIITGRNESTASIYFAVEGPLKDAEVSLLPVKSVEEGVLGILERLIKTPIRLLENEERK